MKKITYTCDRCGKEITEGVLQIFPQYIEPGSGDYEEKQPYEAQLGRHYCEECAGRVMDLLQGKVEEKKAEDPEAPAEAPQTPDTNAGDMISRQAAQHKINALIDEFEIIMKDIRERHVDDSVCGLCEYDGAFMSNSGDWCNECPGFERDDCFKLKDQYREEWAGAIKNLPPVQPNIIKTMLEEWREEQKNEG